MTYCTLHLNVNLFLSMNPYRGALIPSDCYPIYDALIEIPTRPYTKKRFGNTQNYVFIYWNSYITVLFWVNNKLHLDWEESILNISCSGYINCNHLLDLIVTHLGNKLQSLFHTVVAISLEWSILFYKTRNKDVSQTCIIFQWMIL